MEELLKINTTYEINGLDIEVLGNIFQDGKGCYRFRMQYRVPNYTPQVKRDMIADMLKGTRSHDYVKEGGPWEKAELVLNGSGKSKLEKKILKFLKLEFGR